MEREQGLALSASDAIQSLGAFPTKVTHVETVELLPLSAYYVDLVQPRMLNIEERIARGHHVAGKPCCQNLDEGRKTVLSLDPRRSICRTTHPSQSLGFVGVCQGFPACVLFDIRRNSLILPLFLEHSKRCFVGDCDQNYDHYITRFGSPCPNLATAFCTTLACMSQRHSNPQRCRK